MEVTRQWEKDRSPSSTLRSSRNSGWTKIKEERLLGLWKADLLAKTKWAKDKEDRLKKRRGKAQWQSMRGDIPTDVKSVEFQEFDKFWRNVELPASTEREIQVEKTEEVNAAVAGLLRPRRKSLHDEEKEPLIRVNNFPMLKERRKNRGGLSTMETIAHANEAEKFLDENEMRLWIQVLNYGEEPSSSFVRLSRRNVESRKLHTCVNVIKSARCCVQMADIFKKIEEHRLKTCPVCTKSHWGTTCRDCNKVASNASRYDAAV